MLFWLVTLGVIMGWVEAATTPSKPPQKQLTDSTLPEIPDFYRRWQAAAEAERVVRSRR